MSCVRIPSPSEPAATMASPTLSRYSTKEATRADSGTLARSSNMRICDWAWVSLVTYPVVFHQEPGKEVVNQLQRVQARFEAAQVAELGDLVVLETLLLVHFRVLGKGALRVLDTRSHRLAQL